MVPTLLTTTQRVPYLANSPKAYQAQGPREGVSEASIRKAIESMKFGTAKLKKDIRKLLTRLLTGKEFPLNGKKHGLPRFTRRKIKKIVITIGVYLLPVQ